MTMLASDTGTEPSLWNTAMCFSGHLRLSSAQIFRTSFSAIGRYASYSKLMTFFPSKLFLVVPTKRDMAPHCGEVTNCDTASTESFSAVNLMISLDFSFASCNSFPSGLGQVSASADGGDDGDLVSRPEHEQLVSKLDILLADS